MRLLLLFVSIPTLTLSLASSVLADDWPQANHDGQRSGRTLDEPKPPFHVEWVRQFPREVMTTRVEPIVAAGRVFVGTYSGRLHALDGKTGRELWTRDLDGPILHSAAVAEGMCVVATAGGSVYGVKPADGAVLWRAQLGEHGFDTAPLIAKGLVVLGSRGGTLFGLHLGSGQLKWRMAIGPPIRTSAATDGALVYVAAEGMRVRACELSTGKLRWTSAPLPGQSLRDYYPVVVGGRVILRSNPAGHFAERLVADRALLTKNAGIDGSDWRKLDAFLKSDQTRGTPAQIAQEQRAIRAHLLADPDARTFHVLDASSGREAGLPPVLYAAGCQGVGVPAVVGPDGRLLALYRTAYSNWSLGVAPLIGIGYLDLKTGEIQPLRHQSGAQPPWNTFWGTADETTRLTVGGKTLFLSHQGTLASLDLRTRKLSPIAGNRDTWGGYPGVPWARNEWHGPARGAVAISGDYLYWISGSRVIAVRGSTAGSTNAAKPGPPPPPTTAISAETVPLPTVADLAETLRSAPSVAMPSIDAVEGKKLDAEVAAALAETWRPLYVQPGLAGREFCFDRSTEKFESLLMSYPHVLPSVQARVRETLERELSEHPPWMPEAQYSLTQGKPREWFSVPEAYRRDTPRGLRPLEGMHEVWLYATTLDAWDIVPSRMEQWTSLFETLRRTWPAEIKRHDLNTTRIVADLLAYARIASHFAEPTAPEARRMAAEGVLELISWVREYDPASEEKTLGGVTELDQIIGKGDALFQAVKPHRSRIARLNGLTPELAKILANYAPNHLRALFGTIDRMMPGWYLVGEERQVHFGENFVDYPEQALTIYTARAGAGFDPPEKLRTWLDMPFCRADLYDIQKRALYLSIERPDR